MAKIFIYDEFGPEDTAMMQALYSRSPLSVEEHVAKVRETGSGSFMEKFYVGYGHNSIADCGSTTLFVEGLSIIADKALQDWPLYSGQETSTRYIDMSLQPIIDPVKTTASKEIIDDWMKFYVDNQTAVQNHIREKYPKKEDEDEGVYSKAVAARTFDIMRGFLPAGITTQLSWHTNLRQAWDKLALLRHNPLPEARELAENIIEKLKEKYTNSFSHKLYEEQENYRELAMQKHNFYYPKETTEYACRTNISQDELNQYGDIISERPQKTNLPLFLFELGNVTFDFTLDYGSFRDVQRHRNGSCRIPLLTTERGFNQWYLNQLPDNLHKEALELINKQIDKINKLDASPEIKQYYTAMGFNVQCRVSYGLPACIYTVELRSGRLVHPTLRAVALKMHESLHKLFPKLTLHSDLSMDDWDIRRGKQDITEK